MDGAPVELPISLQIASAQPFLFGWLQVPDFVQTSIATSAQRMRLVGATYWALPVVDQIARGPSSDSDSSNSSTPVAASPAPPGRGGRRPNDGKDGDAGN
jgi:hypothetical protein